MKVLLLMTRGKNNKRNLALACLRTSSNNSPLIFGKYDRNWESKRSVLLTQQSSHLDTTAYSEPSQIDKRVGTEDCFTSHYCGFALVRNYIMALKN